MRANRRSIDRDTICTQRTPLNAASSAATPVDLFQGLPDDHSAQDRRAAEVTGVTRFKALVRRRASEVTGSHGGTKQRRRTERLMRLRGRAIGRAPTLGLPRKP